MVAKKIRKTVRCIPRFVVFVARPGTQSTLFNRMKRYNKLQGQGKEGKLSVWKELKLEYNLLGL